MDYQFRTYFLRIALLLGVAAGIQHYCEAADLKASTRPLGTRPVKVFAVLEGKSVAEVALESAPPQASPLSRGGGGSSATISKSALVLNKNLQRAAEIGAQQSALVPQIEALGGQIENRYSRLVNAIKVVIAPEQLQALRQLPGVLRLEVVRQYTISLTNSLPLIHAPQAWSQFLPNADGHGVRIGIIDSGIDYTHADFGGVGTQQAFDANDPRRIEKGSFPTAKVVGGWDFSGDAYDPNDDAHAQPNPDPDPLDCADNGHGSHVAGIAAGLGVLTNGQTYAGAYTNGLDMKQFSIGPGVAPGASLYALKVFGCTGSTDLVTDALEWASDPNQDFDFSDRLDVVNLSLGSPFGTVDNEDTDYQATMRIAQLGSVVVCAAGNSGNTFYITGQPAVTERAISVADSVGHSQGEALVITSPTNIPSKFYMIEGGFTPALTNTGPVSGNLVYVNPPLGCSTPLNAGEIRGNIALIDRATCLFTEKVLGAQTNGAIAAVIVNNQDGSPIVMAGTVGAVTIPAVMISKADGAILKSQLTNGVAVSVKLDAKEVIENVFVDTIHETSSRGPGFIKNAIKPEISAPGAEVTSVKAGSGNRNRTETGTSMASPTVAGAAALVRQVHPDWSTEEVKAALMNGAKPITNEKGNFYTPSRMGAGRLQADVAVRAQVTAKADRDDGLVGLTFGSVVAKSTNQQTQTIVLQNHGTNDATFDITISNLVQQAGVTISVVTNRVTVPAGGIVRVPVQMIANPAQFDLKLDGTTPPTMGAGTLLPRQALYEIGGDVWFSNAAQTLHLPFYANIRAASDLHAATSRLLLAESLSTQKILDVQIPISGASIPSNTVISAFQLGHLSPPKNLGDTNRAMADLLAVGTAVDYATNNPISTTTIYFGLASARSWATPQSANVEFDVLIDVDGDGDEDFVLYNSNASVTNDVSGKDVLTTIMQTIVKRYAVGNDAVGFLNIYGADERDTAPFNNSVLIYSVPAARLGLSATKSTFRYKVNTFASSGSQVDETPWIPVDVTKQVLDTTVAGDQNYPTYVDGQPVSVRLNREIAQQQGVRLPSVLLLHHFNVEGERMEVVTIDLSNDDTDNDGIPDWREFEKYQTLTKLNKDADFDNDGMSDRMEYLAGTDPTNSASVLKLEKPVRISPTQISLRWPSVAGKLYSVERSTDLKLGFDTVLNLDANGVRAPVAATPPTNTFTDNDAADSRPYFYRIRVEP